VRVKNLLIVATALSFVVGSVGLSAAAATTTTADPQATTTVPQAVAEPEAAAAAPVCPTGWARPVAIPVTSYTSPGHGFFPPTTISTPGLCAWSFQNRWYLLSRPYDQPREKCVNPVRQLETEVSAPTWKGDSRTSNITVRCDVYYRDTQGVRTWIYAVKIRVRVKHRCAEGVCTPYLDARYWGTLCVAANVPCRAWSVGVR